MSAREERKAKLAADKAAQRELDMLALDEAEIAHGDERVMAIDVPYMPGLPTLIVVRAPTSHEMKRYRAALKGKDPDTVAASAQLGRSCTVYPDKEVFVELCEKVQALDTTAGIEVGKLSMGRAQSEGKE